MEVVTYAYANAVQQPLKVYCVPGKAKDVSKFTANKKDSRYKKNNKLPSDYYLLKRDDENILQESMRVINSNKHGQNQDMPENWAVDKSRAAKKPMTGKNGYISSEGEEVIPLTPVPELASEENEEVK